MFVEFSHRITVACERIFFADESYFIWKVTDVFNYLAEDYFADYCCWTKREK